MCCYSVSNYTCVLLRLDGFVSVRSDSPSYPILSYRIPIVVCLLCVRARQFLYIIARGRSFDRQLSIAYANGSLQTILIPTLSILPECSCLHNTMLERKKKNNNKQKTEFVRIEMKKSLKGSKIGRVMSRRCGVTVRWRHDAVIFRSLSLLFDETTLAQMWIVHRASSTLFFIVIVM